MKCVYKPPPPCKRKPCPMIMDRWGYECEKPATAPTMPKPETCAAEGKGCSTGPGPMNGAFEWEMLVSLS